MSECISSSMYALPRTNLDTFRTRSFPLCDDSLRTPEQGQYPLLWHLPIHSVELSWATTRSCRSALIIINVVVRLRTVLYRVIPTGCYARLIVGISPETKKTKDTSKSKNWKPKTFHFWFKHNWRILRRRCLCSAYIIIRQYYSLRRVKTTVPSTQ